MPENNQINAASSQPSRYWVFDQMSAINSRLEKLEQSFPKIDGIVRTLAALSPKIEEIHSLKSKIEETHGFITGTGPHLATQYFVSEKLCARVSNPSM